MCPLGHYQNDVIGFYGLEAQNMYPRLSKSRYGNSRGKTLYNDFMCLESSWFCIIQAKKYI